MKTIKDILNDPYFKGLTIEQIIELAKKSIRITTYNRELEKKIENVRGFCEVLLGENEEYVKNKLILEILKM